MVAEYDGKVLVPGEPVNLPPGTIVRLNLEAIVRPPDEKRLGIDSKLAIFNEYLSRDRKQVGQISDEMLRRENLYGDEER